MTENRIHPRKRHDCDNAGSAVECDSVMVVVVNAPAEPYDMPELSDITEAIVNAAQRLGLAPIHSLAVFQAGRYELAINGTATLQHHDGADVRPYEAVVWFNGWPFAVLSLVTGDGAIGCGVQANARTLVESLNGVAAPVVH